MTILDSMWEACRHEDTSPHMRNIINYNNIQYTECKDNHTNIIVKIST